MNAHTEVKADAKPTGLELLRVPFAPNHISKLPKPTAAQTKAVKDDYRAGIRCNICGGWHHPKVVHLDYVGHAALTDRLLDADPQWNWEPLTETGLPQIDENKGMWIKLTVCGVTRLGYGHAEGKEGGDAIKEVIGDALRNAAMRFGAALDLWHKGDLHADDDPEPPEAAPKTAPDDAPQFDANAAADRIKARIGKATTYDELAEIWGDEKATVMKCGEADRELGVALYAARDARKAALKAAETAGMITDDQIPY